ncbi:hypothetical protein JCM8097_003280 [Rhodosporidiobolus ruineniae]
MSPADYLPAAWLEDEDDWPEDLASFAIQRDLSILLRHVDCAGVALEGSAPCTKCSSLAQLPAYENGRNRRRWSVGDYVCAEDEKKTALNETNLAHLNPLRSAAKRDERDREVDAFLDAICASTCRRIPALVRRWRRGRSLACITEHIVAEHEGRYSPRSHTEEEYDLSLLLLRLSSRTSHRALHAALGLPSLDTVLRRQASQFLVPSPGEPEPYEILSNLEASLGAALKDDPALRSCVWQILTDATKGVARFRLDPRTGFVVGGARFMMSGVEYSFDKGAVERMQALKAEGKLAAGTELEVWALCPLGVKKNYIARPFYIAAVGAKKEDVATAVSRTAKVVDIVSWWLKENGAGPIVGLARDGEGHGRSVLQKYCSGSNFQTVLPEPVAAQLADLFLFEKVCGLSGLVYTHDWRHCFKREEGNFGRPVGVSLGGSTLAISELRRFVAESFPEKTEAELDDLLYTGDAMNVAHATRFLHLVCQLKDRPPLSPKSLPNTPSVAANRSLIRYLKRFYLCLLSAFGDAALDLAERLERLAEASFLLLFAFDQNGTSFCSSELAHDLQAAIRSVYVTVAWLKHLNPDGVAYPFQDGTDRLEELFGIARTIHGNDDSVDAVQFVETMTGALQANGVMEKLGLRPKDSRRDLNGDFDHVSPRDVTGDASLASVTSLSDVWHAGQAAATALAVACGVPLPSFYCSPSYVAGSSVLRPRGSLIHSNNDFSTLASTLQRSPAPIGDEIKRQFESLYTSSSPLRFLRPKTAAVPSASFYSTTGDSGGEQEDPPRTLGGAISFTNLALNHGVKGLSRDRIARYQRKTRVPEKVKTEAIEPEHEVLAEDGEKLWTHDVAATVMRTGSGAFSLALVSIVDFHVEGSRRHFHSYPLAARELRDVRAAVRLLSVSPHPFHPSSSLTRNSGVWASHLPLNKSKQRHPVDIDARLLEPVLSTLSMPLFVLSESGFVAIMLELRTRGGREAFLIIQHQTPVVNPAQQHPASHPGPPQPSYYGHVALAAPQVPPQPTFFLPTCQ